MIEKLKSILGKEYVIKETQLGIEVYHLTNYGVNQETYIKIKNYINNWTLYEVQRGESFEICEFENYNIAICGVYILSKKIFEHPKTNTLIRRELSKCMEDDSDMIIRILAKEFNENLFSLNNLKRGAIMLEGVNGFYDINYCGLNNEKMNIVSGRTFSNAVIVFYNYILLLFEFENLIKYITSIIQISEETKEKLKYCYLGK
ncbi:hypothetical protein AAGC94_13935 [Clostridium sporogenes]|uniref:Uncharacterized protein n=1 Tax=Clostridium sporogenes TaxID=1509 RepID=A0ABX4K589_CLOSG|nr:MULTISPECIES: hypothetical protein [Clostridium]MBW5457181.1 hypothetical protein [Clostridium sporogenes]MDU7253515.1 hypothetical protein [Clostridium sp.]NFF62519.1 hypothetical protein [Clostridium sporogenes]NFF78458.1 hypothetical protein [Clostridium sporogenes]NFH47574.1 hypothetical protein [Clostridium sporogenes]